MKGFCYPLSSPWCCPARMLRALIMLVSGFTRSSAIRGLKAAGIFIKARIFAMRIFNDGNLGGESSSKGHL